MKTFELKKAETAQTQSEPAKQSPNEEKVKKSVWSQSGQSQQKQGKGEEVLDEEWNKRKDEELMRRTTQGDKKTK